MQGLGRLVDGEGERAAVPSFGRAIGALEGVEQDRQVLGGGRHEVDHVLVEGDEADAVALLPGEVGEAGRPGTARSRAW